MKSFQFCTPLKRKGSVLEGDGKRWQMLRVFSPSEEKCEDPIEIIKIETTSEEVLVVLRSKTDFGMRFPQLLRVEKCYFSFAL
jgi:hypothetical protein